MPHANVAYLRKAVSCTAAVEWYIYGLALACVYMY